MYGPMTFPTCSPVLLNILPSMARLRHWPGPVTQFGKSGLRLSAPIECPFTFVGDQGDLIPHLDEAHSNQGLKEPPPLGGGVFTLPKENLSPNRTTILP